MADSSNQGHPIAPQPLQAAVGLLEIELERLRSELDTLRMIQHPDQPALIRDAVQRIDLRLDRLDELQRLIKLRGSTLGAAANNPAATPDP